MSKLIIICGLSGSGKTTVASELSKKTGIACIHKDTIKESLYKSLGCSTLEDSKRIGFPSINIMFDLAEQQLANGVDVIMESPLNFPGDYPLFEEWKKKYNVNLFNVICSIDTEERKRRFLERERNEAHHDNQRLTDHPSEGEMEYDYADMPGSQIRVKTDIPVDEIVQNIISQIK